MDRWGDGRMDGFDVCCRLFPTRFPVNISKGILQKSYLLSSTHETNSDHPLLGQRTSEVRQHLNPLLPPTLLRLSSGLRLNQSCLLGPTAPMQRTGARG